MQKFYSTAHRFTALLAFLAMTMSHARAEPSDWLIDPEHFSIAFAAQHIGFQQQLGMFLDASGSFRYDPETRELGAGRVEVQAGSVFSNHEARDDHLRSDDFLDADNHPVIVFEASDYTPSDSNGEEEYGTLTGNLTLLGNTRPVELTVTINKRARYPLGHRRETLGISARTTLLRSQWGMNYAVANNLVGDEVTLRFEFEALRQ